MYFVFSIELLLQCHINKFYALKFEIVPPKNQKTYTTFSLCNIWFLGTYPRRHVFVTDNSFKNKAAIQISTHPPVKVILD